MTAHLKRPTACLVGTPAGFVCGLSGAHRPPGRQMQPDQPAHRLPDPLEPPHHGGLHMPRL
eukprot:scaffold29613_cov25-Prasinocladus_malaysianus.AAC.1